MTAKYSKRRGTIGRSSLRATRSKGQRSWSRRTPRPWSRPAMWPKCSNTETPAYARSAPFDGGREHDAEHFTCLEAGHPGGFGGRSDHPSGHSRIVRDHRRGDGPRPVPNVVFVDYPGVTGPWCGFVRYGLQYTLRVRIDADAYRLDPWLSPRHPADFGGWRVVRG